jgi:Cu2+-exporting ATPase
MELWLIRPSAAPVRFAFSDPPRSDAAQVVARLAAQGYDLQVLSGDRPAAVEPVADAVGIADRRAGLRPEDKVAALARLAAEGRRPLMVGDGLNDAPALATAHASMSPSSGIDVSQTAADVVFQGTRLAPVADALAVARRARALVRQNLVLSLAYNGLALPLAIAGQVTPLIAAVVMSSSSIIVIANALRLHGARLYRTSKHRGGR